MTSTLCFQKRSIDGEELQDSYDYRYDLWEAWKCQYACWTILTILTPNVARNYYRPRRTKTGILRLPKVSTVRFGDNSFSYEPVVSWNILQHYINVDDLWTIKVLFLVLVYLSRVFTTFFRFSFFTVLMYVAVKCFCFSVISFIYIYVYFLDFYLSPFLSF